MDNSTKLRDWIAERGITKTWLARKLCVGRKALHDWLRGASIPNEENAARIEVFTAGAIKAGDW